MEVRGRVSYIHLWTVPPTPAIPALLAR